MNSKNVYNRRKQSFAQISRTQIKKRKSLKKLDKKFKKREKQNPTSSKNNLSLKIKLKKFKLLKDINFQP